MEQPVDPFAPKNTTVTASPELGGSDTSAVEGVEDIEFVFEKSIVGYSKFATAKRLKRLEAALDSISTLKSTATSFSACELQDPLLFWPKLELDLPRAFRLNTQPKKKNDPNNKKTRKVRNRGKGHSANSTEVEVVKRGELQRATPVNREKINMKTAKAAHKGAQPSERIASLITSLEESSFYVDQIVHTETTERKDAVCRSLEPKMAAMIPECLQSALLAAMGRQPGEGGDLFYAHQAEALTAAMVEGKHLSICTSTGTMIRGREQAQ
jgi:hypothetical protein